MPAIPEDGALLKVEVPASAGPTSRCTRAQLDLAVIMGHERWGHRQGGPQVLERQGWRRRPGVRRALRRLLPVRVVPLGEYRHCEATDWRTNPDARPLRLHSSENPFHLWGGFAQYMFLRGTAILHRVPSGVSDEGAGIVTPCRTASVGAARRGRRLQLHRPDPGTGQQGLSQVVAQTGRRLAHHRQRHTRDAARMDLAKRLGADHVIDVRQEDRSRGSWTSRGKGVDVALDCTPVPVSPILLGIDASNAGPARC